MGPGQTGEGGETVYFSWALGAMGGLWQDVYLLGGYLLCLGKRMVTGFRWMDGMIV